MRNRLRNPYLICISGSLTVSLQAAVPTASAVFSAGDARICILRWRTGPQTGVQECCGYRAGIWPRCARHRLKAWLTPYHVERHPVAAPGVAHDNGTGRGYVTMSAPSALRKSFGVPSMESRANRSLAEMSGLVSIMTSARGILWSAAAMPYLDPGHANARMGKE